MRVDLALRRLPISRLRRGQSGYPPVLSSAAAAVRGFDAPDHLAVWGQLPQLAPRAPCVGLIGARACSQEGRQLAARLGAGLARAGVVVVSGAARGIDQAAMHGAQSVGGRVVAVLGSGLHQPYPSDGRELLLRIAQSGGAVVSEFGDHDPPRRFHFPQRNRLIAAFCQAVIVIQGGERSGTMNTVHWALELGREIGAVPGLPGHPTSAGPHRLLREGAFLVETASDVLAALGLDSSSPAACPPRATGPRGQVLTALHTGGKDFGALLATVSLSAEVLRAQLGALELEGVIHRVPGGAYHPRL